MDVRYTLLLLLIFWLCYGVNSKPFKASDTTRDQNRHKRLHKSDTGSPFEKFYSVDEAMAILERLKLKTKRQTESEETVLKDEDQTKTKAKNKSNRTVGVREVSKSNSPLSIKHQITESFIKTFDVIKQALVEFNRDVERNFRQLNDLDTDHFNMVDSDVKANGDKMDRLQKYVVEDLNSCRTGLANLSGENELHKKEIRTNIEEIKNITQTLLNITRIMNDRTERISEIKERELKLALAKEQHRKAKNKTCTKHHCKQKGKSLMSKQRQKLPHLLQKALTSKKLDKTTRSSSVFKGSQHLRTRKHYNAKQSRDETMNKDLLSN